MTTTTTTTTSPPPPLSDNDDSDKTPPLLTVTSSDDEYDDGDDKRHKKEDPLLLVEGPSGAPPKTNKNTTLAVTVNRWLRFYTKFWGSAGNQDKLLKLLQWSLWLVGYYYSNPKKKTSLRVGKYLKNLSIELSFARYVNRLLGFPVAVEAAWNDSWTLAASGSKSSSNTIDKVLGKILAFSMILYFPMEHVAYGLWMDKTSAAAPQEHRKMLTWYGRNANQWSYLSCRCWLAFIVTELTQCLWQYRELLSRQQAPKDDNDGSPDMAVVVSNKEQQQLSNTKWQMVRNVLFLFPCIHWSLPNWDSKPWLKDRTVNILMWAEAVVSLYQAVQKETATAKVA